jgi:hypothetical protein
VTVATAAPAKFSRRERSILEETLWRGIERDPVVFMGIARTLDEHAEISDKGLVPFPVCARCGVDPEGNEEVVLEGPPDAAIARCRAHGIRHKPYLVTVAREWQQAEILPIEKSRHVLLSWEMVLLHLHLTMTRAGTAVGFQSLNLTKANELVERAAIIYRALPVEAQRYGPLSDSTKARARNIEGLIEFPEINSKLFAMPNGGAQVRMYTFTALFQDEAQFWEPDDDYQESYYAALPAVKGGGRLTAVSTINDEGRFHHRLCEGLIT